jgi:hypothetical protein
MGRFGLLATKPVATLQLLTVKLKQDVNPNVREVMDKKQEGHVTMRYKPHAARYESCSGTKLYTRSSILAMLSVFSLRENGTLSCY